MIRLSFWRTFYISQFPYSLQTTEDSLSATICRCDADNNPGINICEKLRERLEFVKAKLEGKSG